MTSKSLICVTCPMGCALEVAVAGDRVLAVEGHGCKRGVAYAADEISDPRRVVTTTVAVMPRNRSMNSTSTVGPSRSMLNRIA